jgi:uncharacterized membrane protein
VTLVAVWLHVLGAIVWLGGVAWQAHALGAAARRGQAAALAESAARARPVAWTALSLLVLTGLYNVTRLGPAERVMESGAGLALAGKFLLVLALIALAGPRDFTQVPRLRRALATGQDPRPALRAIAWLDRLTLLLGAAIVYLGLLVSRTA